MSNYPNKQKVIGNLSIVTRMINNSVMNLDSLLNSDTSEETRKAVNDTRAYLLKACECLSIAFDEVQKIKEAPFIYKSK